MSVEEWHATCETQYGLNGWMDCPEDCAHVGVVPCVPPVQMRSSKGVYAITQSYLSAVTPMELTCAPLGIRKFYR